MHTPNQEKEDKDHDPNKCLSCRFGKLLCEIYPDGVTEDQMRTVILPAVARISGITLAVLGEDALKLFISNVITIRQTIRLTVGDELGCDTSEDKPKAEGHSVH